MVKIIENHPNDSRVKYRSDGVFQTLSSRMGTGGGNVPMIQENYSVRRLTPVECERLQGWPDGYTDVPLNGKPASDSARYKALGNGMAQPCARWIIQRIADVNSKPTTELRRIYMQIKKLSLENFRGIKCLEINFDSKDTDIYGANGTGKTTIANAICWLLTGQPITGEKDFSPKTADSHNLHHKAELTMQTDDGTIVTIAKDFYEKWTKKKGSQTAELTGHTTDYTINGVPFKEKDYRAQVETLMGGSADQIKMLLIVGYFAQEMNADDRRKILVDVCGDVSDEDIMQDSNLEGFRELLLIPGTKNQFYSVDEYKAIAAKQKSKLKKTLETLPIRIDELDKGICIEEDEKTLQAKLESLRAEKTALTNSTSAEAKQALIKGFKAELAQKELDYIKAYQSETGSAKAELDALILSRGKKYGAIRNTTILIQDLRERRKHLLEEWDRVVSDGKWNDDDNICPCCGRELPSDQITDKKKKLKELTDQRKAAIRAKGQECSDAKIQELEAKNELRAAEINKLNEVIESKEKQVVEFLPFAETAEAKDLDEKIQKLIEESEADEPDKAAIDEIDAKIKEVTDRLSYCAQSEKNRARIAELEKEQRETSQLFENAERSIYLCEEFVRLKVKAITDKINSKFHNIGWLLFKDQINGGLKECCEPLIPNEAGVMVEYKSANTAAKVNAGIEIINVLAEHYNIHLPIIVDQAESICEVADTGQQLIRLIVSAPDTDNLRIKNYEK